MMDDHVVGGLRSYLRNQVIARVRSSGLRRVTLDFDGSVQSTRRAAEGTAVGFNRKRKGERSYYRLLCVLSQTGQVFDVLFRSGNVHDSNGSFDFVAECLAQVREALPGVKLEVRMDSAFFQDHLIALLDGMGAEYTISVPFERLAELKDMIERRRRWSRVEAGMHGFQARWKPKSWMPQRRATSQGRLLALCLRKELADRLASINAKLEWDDVVRDLAELQEMHTLFSGKKFVLRSQLKGCVHKLLQIRASGSSSTPSSSSTNLRPCHNPERDLHG